MKNENEVYDMNFSELSGVLAWVAGVVIAQGGWSTFFAIVFPPWAFYVLIEHMFKLAGWL